MNGSFRVFIACLLTVVVVSSSVAAQDAEESVEEESNIIIDYVLPLSLAYIMFSLGLGLKVSDFGLILSEPKAFAVGLGNQMVVLPIAGFGIASIFDLSGEMAVGLMILACCPGGVTSNILTKLAGGDTALSISYTAVVSVVSVITLPLIVGLSMDHFMGTASPNIEIFELGVTMFLLTTVPVMIGMLIRRYSETAADGIEPLIGKIAAVLFIIIVIAAIASEFDTLMENIGTLGPAVVILNILMLGIGWKSATVLDLENNQATTVSIESGIQNATVGITVGGLVLAPEAGATLSVLSLPSGVYGVLMYFVIAPFLYWRIGMSKM
ncbi:MAG TPA: bile acid:sodium symporter family protein [Candidatus Poseidoniales archaeon]|nr:MAG TPA: bile acid:sodium symporter family protein [Candidatus Poseidoniales archaeon]|tara:strand:- start:632 stop:1606 length:975 start_codon:yes stop_codon:yes gene_type:complete